ncbi:NACHT domain-containing protein [Streptomyces sp. NBC_00631]|uniref:NACHT domain-containing protein n=1 Tax=Streptomyces sp. NBC_00631 TaxID=2975793 RepID=UPI0030DFD84A
MADMTDMHDDLVVVMEAVLRKRTAPHDQLCAALTACRQLPFFQRTLAKLGSISRESEAKWAVDSVRSRLRHTLPGSSHEVAAELAITPDQGTVLRCVLAGMSAAQAVKQIDEGRRPHPTTATRWMGDTASLLADWLLRDREGDHPWSDVDVRAYLDRLTRHCEQSPGWFPEGLRFTDVLQRVTVHPPQRDDDRAPAPAEGSGAETPVKGPQDSYAAPLRMPWRIAIRQFRHILLVGEAGSGKSWAVRSRCLELARQRAERVQDSPIPVLVLAPKLEEVLAEDRRDSRRAPLPDLIAAAMPDEVAADDRCVDLVRHLLQERAAVELLIDGYDELRDEKPLLAQRLDRITELLSPRSGNLVLTSRPASVPQRRFARQTTTCMIQPFAEREQLQFVQNWFAEAPGTARRIQRLIRERRLEFLRTPLLLALFCTAAGGAATPPQSEHDLWYRALLRLASDEDRYDQVSEGSEKVRLRLEVLKNAAALFHDERGLLDTVPVSTVEDALGATSAWADLGRITTCDTVVEDLVATGIVRKALGDHAQSLEFLHSAIRDYLIADALAADGSWADHVWRVWSQPEWEPVIGYVGALVADPDPLLLALQHHYDDDPLNAARFTAGRVLAVSAAAASPGHRSRVRDELLVMLDSLDPIDRNRSAQLLAGLQDPETAQLLRDLVHPAAPSRVITAALTAIAGGASAQSLDTLTSCARDGDFTIGEREAAVESLAETGSAHALRLLGDLADDPGAAPAVRACAAFSALRLFGHDDLARRLLQQSDEESRPCRWSLAERVVRGETGRPLIAEVQAGRLEVQDAYCRALLLSVDGATEESVAALAEALPSDDIVDTCARAVEAVRAAVATDPLTATCARFLLNSGQPAQLRWRMAQLVLGTEELVAAALWNEFTSQFNASATALVVDFLVLETVRLPAPLGDRLADDIASGLFGGSATDALAKYRAATALEGEAPEPPAHGQDAAPPPASEQETPSLEKALTASTPMQSQYQLLRDLRRTIPREGAVRELAASLTHAVTTTEATSWIDAQPAMAPTVEKRLVAALRHSAASFTLARLRARWPGRHTEVGITRPSLEFGYLDARAEAALLAGDLDEAATLALASIGARQGELGLPAPEVYATLFAASGSPQGVHSAFRKVSTYLASRKVNTIASILLNAWRAAAAAQYAQVREQLGLLPPYVLAVDAEAAGLGYCAGLLGEDAFESVISWAGCRRTSALLTALTHFRNSSLVTERITSAIGLADRRAAALADRWPDPGLSSPGQGGAPRWTDTLLRMAARLLYQGRSTTAAEIYAAAVLEEPTHPALVNNLGFCQMPDDPDTAMETLERAATLFVQPFGVNVANRMLLHSVKGDARAVLALGEDYYQRGIRDTGNPYLWEMDDPRQLREYPDSLGYIIELSRRAAFQLDLPDAVEEWERRHRLHYPREQSPEER